MGRGHGQHEGCWPWARCPWLRSQLSQLISIQPPVHLCSCLGSSLTWKKDFWAVGSSEDVGTPPIEGARMCAQDPGRAGKGGELELASPPRRGAGLSPELQRCWAAPSEGIWGSLHALSRLLRCANWIKGEAEGEETWRSCSAEHGSRPCDTAGFAELQLKLISFP